MLMHSHKGIVCLDLMSADSKEYEFNTHNSVSEGKGTRPRLRLLVGFGLNAIFSLPVLNAVPGLYIKGQNNSRAKS